LQSGEIKAIADVQVGDSVLAYSASTKQTLFSEVVASPHARNSIVADFQRIVTENGSEVKMTADHLILAGVCGSDLSLMRSVDVQSGNCIQTVRGQEVVTGNEVVKSEGVYTVVTEKGDYIVVNDVVASPFAVNHQVADSVYSIHRALYAIAPAILKLGFVGAITANLGAYFSK